jgi:ketosteroid isomerase-like protein
MLSITSPEIKWEDVSGHIAYEGSDGVKNMVELTLMAIPDCRFTYHGGMKNGNDYVVEWTMSGTAFGHEFACRGASVGETDDAGRILHNRDYWDSRSFPRDARRTGESRVRGSSGEAFVIHTARWILPNQNERMRDGA